jgi:hypothetical protein
LDLGSSREFQGTPRNSWNYDSLVGWGLLFKDFACLSAQAEGPKPLVLASLKPFICLNMNLGKGWRILHLHMGRTRLALFHALLLLTSSY